MAAVAQIDIIINERELAAATDRTAKQIKGSLEPAFQKAGQTSNFVFARMTKDQERARDAASLLSRTLGVELPRQLEKFLARSTALGPALAGAFNVAVVAGFALAIAGLIGKIPELVEKIFDWTGSLKANAEAQKELNPVLIDQEKQLRALNEQYKLIGLEGSRQMAQSQQNIREEIARVTAELKGAIESQKGLRKEMQGAIPHSSLEIFTHDLKALVGAGGDQEKQLAALVNRGLLLEAELRNLQAQLRNTGKERRDAFSKEAIRDDTAALQDFGQALNKLAQISAAAGQAGLDPLALIGAREKSASQEIARLREIYGAMPDVRTEAENAINAVTNAAARERIKIYEEELKKRAAGENLAAIDASEANTERLDRLRQVSQQTIDMEREAAIAILPPWQRADAAIAASADQRIREIEGALGRGEISSGDAARRSAAVWVESFAQMRDRLADSLEGLFDDITSGNIGQRLLSNFKRLVFQLVAQWILGVNQMRAASAGGFGGGGGGILSTLLGGLLGIPLGGGGGGSGGGGLFGSLFGGSANASSAGAGFGGPLGLGTGISSLPLVNNASGLGGLLSLTGGLSGGGGAGSPLNLPAGASFGAKLGGLGGLLMPGLGLAGQLLLGSNNRIATTVGGFLTGGVIGTAIGAIFGGLTVFLGPIGAIVGAILGFLLGGRKKRQRERLEQQLIGEIKKVEDAYKNHQIDFDSTIAQLEQLRGQFVDAQKTVGGGPHRRVHSHIDQAEKEIRAIEDERKRRQEVVFGPAEFHRGGFVSPFLAMRSPGRAGARSFHSGDVVNANLLVGEGVLNRQAMRTVGKAGLGWLNSGGGGEAGVGAGLEIHLHFPNVYDSRGFEETLKKNEKPFIRFVRRLEAEGAF